MTRVFQQSTAVSHLMLKAVLAVDHYTPATGLTIPITISKNGGAFANPSAGATNATEVSDGWYFVALSATDTVTLGDLVVLGKAATMDDIGEVCQVVNPSVFMDMAAGVETGLTVRQALMAAAAVLFGKVTGGQSGTEVFRAAVSDAKARVTITDDVSGNRSNVTTDFT